MYHLVIDHVPFARFHYRQLTLVAQGGLKM